MNTRRSWKSNNISVLSAGIKFLEESANVWVFSENIASSVENCDAFITKLVDQLDELGWQGRDEFGIRMAMEEAIMNAIEHGNQNDPNKKVAIFVRLTPLQFLAKVTDEGEGFDPLKVPDPTLEENLSQPSGRGVMLIKQYVDVARYNAIGNKVELSKTNTSTQSNLNGDHA